MTHKLLLAEYKDPNHLLKAAKVLSSKGYTAFETYSPFPIHGDGCGYEAENLQS